MPWTKGVLLFIALVMTFSSFTKAGLEAFSEAGGTYGAVSGDPMHLGKLLIGGGGSASENKMGTSGLSSADQSDEDERFRLAKAKLQRLSPSLHCGNDSMTLRVPGPRTPHFLVDRGEGSPVSLSEVPASCGFSLKRVRRDVSFVAPYKGCHVRQQGGSYVLPLIIMGAPVQMSCPVSPRLPVVSCSSSAMTVSLCVRADDVLVKIDGLWMPLPLMSSKCLFTLETVGDLLVVTAPFIGSCWEIRDNERHLPVKYGGQELVLSCPSQPAATVSPASTAPVQDPLGVPQMFPYFPYGAPWWYSYLKRPTTTTPVPPAQDPIPPQSLNQLYPVFNPYYFYSKGVIPAAPQQPQQSWYPMIPPNYDFPQFNPITPAPTTTAAQFVPYPGYPLFPMFYPYRDFKPERRGEYPFMPYLPRKSIFTPQSLNSVPPPWLDSIYRPRWQKR